MKCPQCGSEMDRYRCLRCGYAVKDVVLSDEENDEEPSEQSEGTREIDPDSVHLSRSSGNLFDEIFGGSIFGGMGGFGSVFDGLFGGIFGGDEPDGYDDDPRNFDDFGNELAPKDVFTEEAVEIHEVEFFSADEKNNKRKDRGDKSRKKN